VAAGPRRTPDDLPDFSTLTNDEDRERKAETQRPGFYAVVATPDSFSRLPEYATATASSRQAGPQSPVESLTGPTSSSGPQQVHRDPNTVLLDIFEESSPPPSATYAVSALSRRGSFPDTFGGLRISTPANVGGLTSATSSTPRVSSADDDLVTHFREHIVKRLIQPVVEGQNRQSLVLGTTRDVFEIEAARYRPVSVADEHIY
jgi:hypothetical protein